MVAVAEIDVTTEMDAMAETDVTTETGAMAEIDVITEIDRITGIDVKIIKEMAVVMAVTGQKPHIIEMADQARDPMLPVGHVNLMAEIKTEIKAEIGIEPEIWTETAVIAAVGLGQVDTCDPTTTKVGVCHCPLATCENLVTTKIEDHVPGRRNTAMRHRIALDPGCPISQEKNPKPYQRKDNEYSEMVRAKNLIACCSIALKSLLIFQTHS